MARKPMQVLILDDEINSFKWEDIDPVEYEDLYRYGYYTTVSHKRLANNKIYDIKNDVRKKYVFCKNCGELVAMNKTEEHAAKAKEKVINADCAKCNKARFNNRRKVTEKITKNSDGTYNITTKSIAEIKCNASYSERTIEYAKAEYGCCKYYQCTKAGSFLTPNDLLISHPDAFATIATVNALNKSKKWKITDNSPGEIRYSLGATNLTAICNEYGIVTRFEYINRRTGTVRFRYSAKLDKFYSEKNTEAGLWQLPDSKRELWMNYIRDLYKEEE